MLDFNFATPSDQGAERRSETETLELVLSRQQGSRIEGEAVLLHSEAVRPSLCRARTIPTPFGCCSVHLAGMGRRPLGLAPAKSPTE